MVSVSDGECESGREKIILDSAANKTIVNSIDMIAGLVPMEF